MFSTKLNEIDRFVLPCIIVTDTPNRHSFVVDTGARYTCCSVYNINPNLREEDFGEAECKQIGGLVYGSVIKYYRLDVKQFTIGNIDLKQQSIWITVDDRATDDVLGMDLMKQVFFLNDPEKNTLCFFESRSEIASA